MEASEAAQQARERLHEEIERVRKGVEEMLDEQENRAASPHGPTGDELRQELDRLRLETRGYVKRRVRKSEKKLKRSIRELEARSDKLEQRLDQVETGRQEAEYRIHSDTERMLDGLLEEVRAIADRLEAHPTSPTSPAEPPAPEPAPPMLTPSPKGPIRRVGPRPLRRGK